MPQNRNLVSVQNGNASDRIMEMTGMTAKDCIEALLRLSDAMQYGTRILSGGKIVEVEQKPLDIPPLKYEGEVN